MTAADGHYYRKQLGCANPVIAWSHRSRFEMAVRLVGESASARLLDYGCGDGTFLTMTAPHVREAWGADVDAGQIEDCKKRLASLHFREVHELGADCDHRFDVVTCMETLEHCPAPIVETVLSDLRRLCAPGGRVFISVPIEIGPTFLIKMVLRNLAAWRGLSDYKHYERYPLGDALAMLFAGSGTTIDRPIYGEAASPFHSHYGFNWRGLRKRVMAYLRVERTLFTPIAAPGGLVSSQAWFVCRPRS